MMVKFVDFLNSLNGLEEHDSALLWNMFYQPTRIQAESGLPVTLDIHRVKGPVYKNRQWVTGECWQLDVYAKIEGRFWRESFATEPILGTNEFGPDGYEIYSEYIKAEYASKPELARMRSLFNNLMGLETTIIFTGENNPGDARWYIENFALLWDRAREREA